MKQSKKGHSQTAPPRAAKRASSKRGRRSVTAWRLRRLASLYRGPVGLAALLALVLLGVALLLLALERGRLVSVFLIGAAAVAALLSTAAASLRTFNTAARARKRSERRMRHLMGRSAARLKDVIEKTAHELEREQAATYFEVDGRLKRADRRHRRLESQLQRDREEAQQALADLASQVQMLGEELRADVARVADRLDGVMPVLAEHESVQATLDQRIDEVSAAAADSVGKAEARTRAIEERVAILAATPPPEPPAVPDDRLLPLPPVPERSHAFNSGYYQPFRRHLLKRDLQRLETHWTEKLGCRMTRAELGYLAHRVGVVEDTCRGRLAKSVEGALLMMLVARAAQQNAASNGRSLRVLEVGTLFGIGVALIYEACRDHEVGVHIDVIDPLDGYYGRDVHDIVTGVPVSREIWEANLESLGLPPDSRTLHQMPSHEAFPVLQHGNLFDFIVIDADHSYDGVKLDGEAAIGLLEPGGYLLFDDYRSPDWPDIQRYVDDNLLCRPELQRVGDDFASIVFRRV